MDCLPWRQLRPVLMADGEELCDNHVHPGLPKRPEALHEGDVASPMTKVKMQHSPPWSNYLPHQLLLFLCQTTSHQAEQAYLDVTARTVFGLLLHSSIGRRPRKGSSSAARKSVGVLMRGRYFSLEPSV